MKFGYFSALHDPDLAKGFSGVLDDFLTELAFIEELGFEGVWTGEHHLGPEGIHNVICWVGAGGYPHEQVMETLALFESEVMPKFLDPA